MSRITQDQNLWGTGDLNGSPSSAKTNGQHVKRYGPLGAGGVSGVVKGYGSEHEVVFELTGDEILTDGGFPWALALPVAIPAEATIGSVSVVVHDGFLAGSSCDIMMVSQDAAQGALTAAKSILDTTSVVPGEYPVDLVSEQWSSAPKISLTAIDVQTFDLGGTLYIDFTNTVADPASKAGGRAEVIVTYRAL